MCHITTLQRASDYCILFKPTLEHRNVTTCNINSRIRLEGCHCPRYAPYWKTNIHRRYLSFLRATAVPAGTSEARISYGNSVCLSVCPSVCLSVTTRWYTKPRWDTDSGSSPYDSLDSLVSNEVIWCQWVRRFPCNEGIKEGYSP